MKGSNLGVGGTVSALLTILLLVAGFAVSTGLLSAIYSAQSEVLRKAVNVGEAVSERLQAFVYEDVRTNRTLLTVRNVGSVGSEVEYLMAVGYDGNVLKEVRLNDTIKLGTQQAYTTYLSNLLGNEFNNYTDVRSRMAVLYLKTFKGGVFGSAYMAPPSVMTAAYATSTTTLSSTETSTEQVKFWTGETTIATWTATIIVSNPDRWPVNAYVGVAFMRNMPTSVNYNGWSGSLEVGMGRRDGGDTSFPPWGWQPGLKATDRNGEVRDVTPSDIRLPKYVACAKKNDDSGRSFTAWTGARRTMLVLVSFSELGPKYLVKRYNELSPNTPNIRAVPLCGAEEFIPYGVTMRLIGPTTAVFPTSTFVTTTNTPSTYTTRYTTTTTATITTTTYYWVWTTITTTDYFWTYTRTGYVPTTMTYTRTTTMTLTTRHATATGIPTTITTTQYGTLSAGRSTDVKDNQVFTFPGRIYAVTDAYFSSSWNQGWYYYKIAYKLAYIKVVNYWNTTETLAYTDGSSTLYVRADRPLGIAAVYVFDDVSETRPPPPPPPPPPGPCVEIRANPYCVSDDAEGKVDVQSPPFYTAPCGSPYGTTITATTNNENCEGFITNVPSGPVTVDQTTPCNRNGNTRSCTLTDPSQRVIWDCDH